MLWSYWVFCANSYWSVVLAPRLLNVIQLNVFNACLLSNHLISRCTYWVFQSFKCTALCKCILQIQLNTMCHSLLLITAQVTYTWQISMIFICILMFVVLPRYNLQIYSLNLTLYEILNSNLTFFFMDVLVSVKSPVDKPLLFKWLNVK